MIYSTNKACNVVALDQFKPNFKAMPKQLAKELDGAIQDKHGILQDEKALIS